MMNEDECPEITEKDICCPSGKYTEGVFLADSVTLGEKNVAKNLELVESQRSH